MSSSSSLFGSQKAQEKPPATDAKEVSEADVFQAMASNEPGLLIAACTIKPSGCIDWGRCIKAEFPKMDSVCLEDTTSGYQCYDTPKISPWKYIVVTGCGFHYLARILFSLPNEYDIEQIKDIFVILPPHLTKAFDRSTEYTSFCIKQQLYANNGYRLHILKAGIDISHSFDIGMPTLYPDFHSTYQIPEDCYGLLYHRHRLDHHGKDYLDAYFSQVAIAGKTSKKLPITVIALSINDSEQPTYQSCAEKYGIQINFKNKLPQADFLNAMKEIGKKGGIISADGAYTLMQALDLGAIAFGYYSEDSTNLLFYHQLHDELPWRLQPVGGVMLGFNKSYELLNDTAAIKNVASAWQKIIQKSTKKFNADHQRYQLFKQIDHPTAGPVDQKDTVSKSESSSKKLTTS